MPVGWSLIRAKYLLTKLDRAFRAEDIPLICTNKGKVIERGETNCGLVSSDEMNYQGVHPGDLLIHGMDTWHGAIAMSDLGGKCTTVVHVCDSEQDKRFLCYYYQALAYQNVYKLISNGIRQNTSDFRSFSKFGEIPTFVPPLREQQSIADYLDERCAAIDEVRHTIEDEIEALQRLRMATIYKAVTKGLDSCERMKDSGVGWIGSIPERWTLRRWKYMLTERKEKNDPVKLTQILSLSAERGVTLYDESKRKGGNKAKEDLSAYRIARKGDIVLNCMNIVSGSVALSEYDGCVSPVYFPYYPSNEHDDVRYYSYILQTTAFQRSLVGLGHGILMHESSTGKLNTVRTRISPYMFGQLLLPCVASDEQQHIADYLDERCAAIDSVIDTRTRQLQRLDDYRRAFIFAYVTGKKEVPSHE